MLDLGLAGGKRRRKTIYGQSENEVLQKLSKLRAARDRGLDLLAPTWTMGQWLDAWLSEIKKFDGTRPATLTLYKGLAERYVKPVIGGVLLDRWHHRRLPRQAPPQLNDGASNPRPAACKDCGPGGLTWPVAGERRRGVSVSDRGSTAGHCPTVAPPSTPTRSAGSR